ncbi:MAG: hypothetical protein ACK4L8_08570 [Nitrincola lacisaponensis]|uniref:hypothetical protein n=1 Tax=Nitrincola lacisaponensis TaxID=267850 RepID=UPI003918A5FF
MADLSKCDCLNYCGDDPKIGKGLIDPCQQFKDRQYQQSRPTRVRKWAHTSADDLKSTLKCLLENKPAETAKDCLYALLHADVKGKTHRKHLAAALRAASKHLEEVPHD